MKIEKFFAAYAAPRTEWLRPGEMPGVLCYSVEDPGTTVEGLTEDDDSDPWEL